MFHVSSAGPSYQGGNCFWICPPIASYCPTRLKSFIPNQPGLDAQIGSAKTALQQRLPPLGSQAELTSGGWHAGNDVLWHGLAHNPSPHVPRLTHASQSAALTWPAKLRLHPQSGGLLHCHATEPYILQSPLPGVSLQASPSQLNRVCIFDLCT